MSRVCVCLAGVFLLSSAAGAQQAGFTTFSDGVGTTTVQVEGGVVVGNQFGLIQTGPQPPRDPNVPQTGTSRIRGRVTSEDGRPVRRATVQLTSPGRDARTASTDVDGRFDFRDLPAARFMLAANKPTFIAANKTIELAANQEVRDAYLTITTGAVITGRIVDEFGDPVLGAAVAVLRSQFTQGRRRLLPAGRATTNDIGEFRVFGLAAGQFYVSASASQQGLMVLNGIAQIADSGYAPTYYPGTPDLASAQRVTVNAGQTLNGIDMAVSPARLARISGVALDAEGRPLPGGGVSAMLRGEMAGLNPYGGQLQADGTFTIPNVPPGEYVVRANARPQTPPAPGRPPAPPVFSMAIVTVSGEDLTGVTLAPFAPAVISGRVVFADQGAAQTIKPSAIRINALAMNPEQGMTTFGPVAFNAAGEELPPIRDDFTFSFTAPAGPVLLRATLPPPASGSSWGLTAIRVHGVDVTDTTVELKPGEVVDDVEAELTNRMPQVSGLITQPDGRPAAAARILLFSQNRDLWTAASNRHVLTIQAGEDGRYNVGSLPPGSYYAAAFDRTETGNEWQDPDFLSNIRGSTSVSLAAGESKTLDLKVLAR